MKEYLDIKRNPIFVTMKTLLFFVPIGMITNNIYISLYGDYVITLKLVDLNISHAIVAFVVFCIISFISYYIETELLPMILISIDEKLNIESNSFLKTIKSHDLIFEKLMGQSFLRKYKESENKYSLRVNLYSFYMFFPIMIILWLIAFNTIICYLSILLIIALTIYLFNGLNTYLHGCNNNSII
jgi:hypothetical protein